ncbi:putative esterase [Owenweeksia hongkongensis DSM 17368]|uniref:Putative esterase n=1 Tax=Owenweeksia hongkongensis (strain DSM 17368 / CIP 108786 / JCM 12287 / NRRL B-23963 / UST20020801) TaxID=926562 RepID=G8R3F0_OWEHD|nr:alpha/beta fold hydrolase [Owenweeksia hongkongensis]AEV31971.1 putative esterase [Owenweeksia hongkongensis DSM 17368]
MSASLSLVHEVLPPQQKTEKPPLLLMLHGFGSHEQDLFGMAPMLNEKCFVVSARAPIDLPWGGYAWYEIDFSNLGEKMNNVPQAKKSMEAILKFIDEVHEAYGTDPENVNLLGFSQGSILSYGLSLSHPEKFQKVIALSGYIMPDIVPEKYNPESLKHLDIFASHGTADEVLPVDWARNAMKVLEQLNISHQYREYAMGHGVSPECFEDLKSWMKEKGVK